MALYKYKAKDADGRTLSGTMEVESERSLVNLLRERGLVIVGLSEEKRRRQLRKRKRGKVKSDDLVVFSRQLATMVNAGLPLIQGLNVLNEQMENRTFQAIGKEIEQDIEGGANLSDALDKHPQVFSRLFVNLVKAGEASGMLDEILDRVATYLEEAAALRRKVKSSLVYPAIITAVAILVLLFMMIVVVPSFEEIFTGLGGTMPLATQLLINLSKWIRKSFVPILGGLGIGVFLFRRYLRTDTGRLRWDRFTLNVPVFGSLLRKVAISKFSRTLSTLLKSGVPILGSLEIVARTSGNRVVEQALDSVRSSIREGESIAEPLGESGVFPPMVVRMISVGEQTGAVEEMLGKISDFYDEQVNTAVASLTSMIEPFIIVFLGLVIGGIVTAMFLPIFKMGELVQL